MKNNGIWKSKMATLSWKNIEEEKPEMLHTDEGSQFVENTMGALSMNELNIYLITEL